MAPEFEEHHAAVLMSVGMARRKRNHAIAIPQRLVESLQLEQSNGAIVTGLHAAGIEGDCASVAGERFLMAAERPQGRAAIGRGGDVIGRQSERALVALQSFLEATKLAQGDSSIVKRVGIVAGDGERLVIAIERIGEPAHLEQRSSTVLQRADVIRSQRKDLVVMRERLGMAAERIQSHTAIIMRIEEVGSEPSGPAEELRRRLEIPLLRRDEAEEIVRVDMFRLALDDVLVKRFGAAEIPRFVEADGELQGVSLRIGSVGRHPVFSGFGSSCLGRGSATSCAVPLTGPSLASLAEACDHRPRQISEDSSMDRRAIGKAALATIAGLFSVARAKAAVADPGAVKVVYHLADLDKVTFVLGNIANHYEGMGGPDKVTIALVIHGPALKGVPRLWAPTRRRPSISRNSSKTASRPPPASTRCGRKTSSSTISCRDLPLPTAAAWCGSPNCRRKATPICDRDGFYREKHMSETDFSGDGDETRLFFPALGKVYGLFAPYSYSFMRFCTGAILVPHGYAKFFEGGVWRTGGVTALGLSPPLLWSFLVAGTEFFGAILLAIGLFTRFAAAAVTMEMLVITFFIQWKFGYLWTNKGYEFSLLWALLTIAIFFRGGGRYSVDHWLGWEL